MLLTHRAGGRLARHCRISAAVLRWRHRRVLGLSLSLSAAVLSAPASGQTWNAAGPETIYNGQTEGIGTGATANPVIGAVQVALPVPGSPNSMLLGAVNGGIWMTTNLNAASPTWASVTPTPATTSESIGAMAFNLTNSSQVYAGFGDWTNYFNLGGPLSGLLSSSNGGTTWAPFTAPNLSNVDITGMVARGNGVVVVTGGNVSAVASAAGTTQGLFRPASAANPDPNLADPPATIINIAGNATSGLPAGTYTSICNAPGNLSAMYAAVVKTNTTNPDGSSTAGVYYSTDAGQTWTQVYSAPAMTANIRLAGRDNTFGGANTVYAAVATLTGVGNPGIQLSDVLQFTPGGGAPMDMQVPTTKEGTTIFGVNPGGQGDTNLTIVADPTNANVVYVGGDTQPNSAAGFPKPNSIGAMNYGGRLFRGTFVPDTGAGSMTTWAPITNNGTNNGPPATGSSPHADSRSMTFVGNTMYETDDGGIYQQTAPAGTAGVWNSAIGTGLQVSEVYDVAYDSNAKIIMVADQDTGAAQQSATGSKIYQELPALQGDGGVVLVANTGTQSLRYASSNGVSNMEVTVYNKAGGLVSGPTDLAMNESGSAVLTIGNNEVFARTPAPVALNTADTTGMSIVLGTGAKTKTSAGAVWESINGGGTFTQVSMSGAALANGVGITSVISGGFKKGVANTNVLFAGTNAPSLYRRMTAGGKLDPLPAYSGGTPWALALDTQDWSNLYVDDTNIVNGYSATASTIWLSENADAPMPGDVTFTNFTGNLDDPTIAGPGFVAQSILFVPAGLNSLILACGLGGVYESPALGDSEGQPVWSLVGAGMPNVTVMSMTYDPTSNLLVAGTLGRGAWTMTLDVPEPSALSMLATGAMLLIRRSRKR